MSNKFDQNYELTLIFDVQAKNVQDKVNVVLQKECDLNPDDVKVEDQGNQTLAYPIKKNKSGRYFTLTFTVPLPKARFINNVIKKFAVENSLIRHLLINQNEFLKLTAKQKVREDSEIKNHRDLNKSKKSKICIIKYLGYKDVDYKNVELIGQFVSPYAKIFSRKRTGVSSKYQRKVTRAIKRARHIALIPFTPKHNY
jgi:small subunit ribosomal protein S18